MAQTQSVDLFTEQHNQFSFYKNYQVYEYKSDGSVLISQFDNSTDAYDFVNQFTNASSRVYLLRTACVKTFDPMDDSDSETESETENETETESEFEEEHENSLEQIAKDYESEEEEEEEEELDLSDYFYHTYGKGYLLHPSPTCDFKGLQYFHGSWWMAKHKCWFFKREFKETFDNLGAIEVDSMPPRKKVKSVEFVDESDNVPEFSGMTFAEYGKGYLLTTTTNDSRYQKKYLVEDMKDSGFWNQKAGGWFFKQKYHDYLIENGAQYQQEQENQSQTSKPNVKLHLYTQQTVQPRRSKRLNK